MNKDTPLQQYYDKMFYQLGLHLNNKIKELYCELNNLQDCCQSNANKIITIGSNNGSVIVTSKEEDGSVHYNLSVPQLNLTGGTNIVISGTYPNLTISSTTNEGTVTSVDAESLGEALLFSGGPIESAGILYLSWTGNSNQYVAGDGSLVNFPSIPEPVDLIAGNNISITGTYPQLTIAATGIPTQFNPIAGDGITLSGTYPNIVFTSTATGTGSVSSVNASISGALSVAGGPITNSGTLAFSWTGTSAQYVKGDGTLGTFPAIPLEVNIIAGEGISVTGTYPDITITNTAPDVPVVLNGTGTVTVTGTYPNFTINGTGGTYTAGTGISIVGNVINAINNGTVTSVNASISGALNVSGGPITTSGTLTFNWTGLSNQYVRGDGTLATFPTIPTVNNGTLTISTLGIATGSGTFTANQSTNTNVTITVPGTNLGSSILGNTVTITSSTGTSTSFNIPSGGTVTEVDAVILNGDSLTVTGGPIDSIGTFEFEFQGDDTQYINGEGDLITFPNIPAQVNLIAGANVAITGTYPNLTISSSGSSGGGGTVLQVNPGLGMNFSSFTISGDIDLGTPSNITLASTNSVTGTTHTHAFVPGGTNLQYIAGDGSLIAFPAIPTVNNNTITIDTEGIASGGGAFTLNQNSNETITINVPGTDLGSSVIGGDVTITSSTGDSTTFTLPSYPTIYRGDDSLISDRTVDGDGHSLKFTNINGFGIDSTDGIDILNNNETITISSSTSTGVRILSSGTSSYYQTIKTDNLTNNRIVQHPDKSGTYAYIDDIPVLSGGTGISITGTYPNLTIVNTATGTTYTGGTGISIVGSVITNTAPNATHTGDVTGSTALTISNNAVTDAKFRQSLGLSVVGRSGNTTGNVADIVASTNNTLLRRSGTSIGFGTIGNAYITDLDYSKLTNTPTIPAQVNLIPGTNISITGSYPNLTINATGIGTGTVTSVNIATPTGLTSSGGPITTAGTITLGLQAGYSIPTIVNQNNWSTSYDNMIVSAGFSGTTTKTLTLTQQDGGIITASFSDTDTTYLGSTSITLVGNSFQRAALTGDVTAPSNSNITTISNNAVTFAKMQDISGGLIGRYSSGTGDPQLITIGTGLTLDSTTGVLSAAGGAGTVTSLTVGNLSPIFTASVSNSTTTPTVSFSQVSQSANLVFASPNGSAGNPTFRKIFTDDITDNTVTFNKIQQVSTATLVGRYSSGTGNLQSITIGTGLNLNSSGVLSASTSGTVTSIGISTSGALSTSGSPITSSGIITLGWTGNTSQYVRGDGSLATFPTIPGAGDYIQNQFSSAQIANGWISGTFKADTQIHGRTLRAGGGINGTTRVLIEETTFNSGNTQINSDLQGFSYGSLLLQNLGGNIFLSHGSGQVWALNLAGSGTRMVTVASDGLLGSQAIPGGGTGTVTSFSAGNLSPLFTTSVSNNTTTPSLSFALSNAGSNTWFGNATGSSTTPSFNSAGALTKTDDTNVTLTLGGTPSTALLKSVSITAGWTGTLAVSRGGTGVSSITGVVIGNGTSAMSGVTGTAGQVLRRNLSNTGYEFYTPATGGSVTSINVSANGALSSVGGPVTTSGTIVLDWTGGTSQYVRGDGSLATFPTIPTSGDYIQNQNAVDQTANFRISGTGTADVIRAGINNSGHVRLQPDGSGNYGFVEIYENNSNRRGYIGYHPVGMHYQAEGTGKYHRFNANGLSTGTPIVHIEPVSGQSTLDPTLLVGTGSILGDYTVVLRNSSTDLQTFITSGPGAFIPDSGTGDGGFRITSGKSMLFGDASSSSWFRINNNGVNIREGIWQSNPSDYSGSGTDGAKILVRNVDTGKFEQLNIGTNLTISGSTLNATGGGGSDTNFATNDLTFTASRTHDGDGYSVNYVDFDNYTMNANKLTLNGNNVYLAQTPPTATEAFEELVRDPSSGEIKCLPATGTPTLSFSTNWTGSLVSGSNDRFGIINITALTTLTGGDTGYVCRLSYSVAKELIGVPVLTLEDPDVDIGTYKGLSVSDNATDQFSINIYRSKDIPTSTSFKVYYHVMGY